jgi:hypothetical protein
MIGMLSRNPIANVRTPQGPIDHATHSDLANKFATSPNDK